MLFLFSADDDETGDDGGDGMSGQTGNVVCNGGNHYLCKQTFIPGLMTSFLSSF